MKDNINELERILGRGFRLLVVDDSKENIQLARESFESLIPGQVDYALNVSDAEKLLEKSYEEKKRYSLVLSDLDMNGNPIAGFEVVRKSYFYNIYSLIVTSANYDADSNAAHGPNTYFQPRYIPGVRGRKSEPGVWEKLFDNAIKEMLSVRGKKHLNNLELCQKRAGSSWYHWAIVYQIILDGEEYRDLRISETDFLRNIC